MRCDDVAGALGAPLSEHDVRALTEHLAVCPTCGARFAREARLTRLWDATRPAEPSAAAWDAVWARVAAGIEAPAPAPAVSPIRRFGLRRSAVAWLALAQAAAVFAAVTTIWALQRTPVVAPQPMHMVQVAHLEFDDGSMLIRQNAAGQQTVQEIELNDNPFGLDGNLAMFNEVEGMAKPE
jgi:hypothetical protein